MRKVLGLATSEEQLGRTLERLARSGFADNNVTVLRTRRGFWQAFHCTPPKIVAIDFAVGAVLGIVVYGLASGLAIYGESLLGFNHGMAFDILLIFGALGVLVGGGLGLVFGTGVAEEDGRAYMQGIRQGKSVLLVETADEDAEQCFTLLTAAGMESPRICGNYFSFYTGNDLHHTPTAT